MSRGDDSGGPVGIGYRPTGDSSSLDTLHLHCLRAVESLRGALCSAARLILNRLPGRSLIVQEWVRDFCTGSLCCTATFVERRSGRPAPDLRLCACAFRRWRIVVDEPFCCRR